MKLYPLLLLLCLLTACGGSSQEYMSYHRADIVTSQLKDIEKAVKVFASENELTVFDKPPRNMKTLSMGDEAFFIVYYYNDEVILTITNVGVASVLSVGSIKSKNITDGRLHELTDGLLSTLSAQFHLNFNEIDPKTSVSKKDT